MAILTFATQNAPFIYSPNTPEYRSWDHEFTIEPSLEYTSEIQVLANVNDFILDHIDDVKEQFPGLQMFIRQTMKGNTAYDMSLSDRNKVSFITNNIRELYAYVKGAHHALKLGEDGGLSETGEDPESTIKEWFSISTRSDKDGIIRALELCKNLHYSGYKDHKEEQSSASGNFQLVLLQDGLVGLSDFLLDIHITWEQNYMLYYYVLGLVNTLQLIHGVFDCLEPSVRSRTKMERLGLKKEEQNRLEL